MEYKKSKLENGDTQMKTHLRWNDIGIYISVFVMFDIVLHL